MTEKAVEQIPWAKATKVTTDRGNVVGLEGVERTTADVWRGGFEWWVLFDSEVSIKNYMSEDPARTRSIQQYFEENRHGSFQERIEDWLKGVEKELPREGPKEWRPKRGRIGRIIEDEGYSYGNTYNDDSSYWWGSVFEYAHVGFEDGDVGAVIVWHRGGDPRGNYHLPVVYLGRFDEFMDAQREGDPHSPDAFLRWNEFFENGFMWAWERMGVFGEPEETLEGWETDKRFLQVSKAIRQDPSILLPESVEKIIEKFDEFPEDIQKAVRWLMGNKRREIERALGQRLIWEDLYGRA